MISHLNHLLVRGALCWTLLCASACHSAPYIWVNHRSAEAVLPNPPVIIGPGDTIEVQVFEDEKMSARGRVLADGTFSMPVLGPVSVAGKTCEGLGRFLETELTRYVQAPKVTVMIHESLLSVAVIGEVKEAGVVDLAKPATVLQALAKAGGLTEYAASSGIFVLRTDKGATQRIRFDYDALIEGEAAAMRFHLKTGDVLVVE